MRWVREYGVLVHGLVSGGGYKAGTIYVENTIRSANDINRAQQIAMFNL